MTFQLIYWGTYLEIYPEINLPVYLHAFLSSNHKDQPVTTATSIPAHRCTRSLPYLFILIISFRQTVCTYLSSDLLYSHIYPFINRSMCVCFAPCFTCTLICQLICLSAYRQIHPKINVPANFDTTWYVNLPVHLQTRLYTHRSCSSWSFISG